MHQRLGVQQERQPISNRLEEKANALVPDEEPFRRVFEREPDRPLKRTDLPQWCPGGLTKSQKRRVQRVRRNEQLVVEGKRSLESGTRSQVWRPKAKASSAADINMVFVLPSEFAALADDNLSEDEDQVASAQLTLGPMEAIFKKPDERRRPHLKALFLKGLVNGQPMTRMLVDGGAAINIMPYVMLRKIGKNDDDLAETDMLLKDFEGNVSAARGVLSVDLTVGSKTMPTLFFVVNGKGAYNLLLGRDWIHANCCVPSTLHQCVVQWVGDAVEVVPADAISNVAAADMPQWSTLR